MRKAHMARTLALLLPLAAAACAVGPDYRPAPPPPPANGAFITPAPGTSAAEPQGRWWRLYDDPVLDRLVERALAANTDLRVAIANLAKARAALREVDSTRLPSTNLSGKVAYGDAASGPGQTGGSDGRQWSYSSGVDISWEADLFGRLSRTVEAARADAEAIAATRDGVAVTVAAETARAYADACAFAQSEAVARDSIGIAERSLAIVAAQEKAGSAARLDVERSATALANARAGLPPIENSRRAALLELAALLGATPAEIPEEARSCRRPPAPAALIPVGDGRGLLARRPDIRAAERRLAADTARIGVATADLFPRISLGGSGDFFRDDQVRGNRSFSFSLGPLISWTLPNISGARAHIAQAKAGAQASLAAFDGTVLTALKEVEQALSGYRAAGEREAALAEAARRADAAYRLADQRYRAGSISFLDALDAQRTLLDARAVLAAAQQQLGSVRVTLFKALGGGWESGQADEPGP